MGRTKPHANNINKCVIHFFFFPSTLVWQSSKFFVEQWPKSGTRKPDGQNRVPLSTLVPGRHLIGQRLPRPDSGRISNGSTRFWLLISPSATRFQSHLPNYGRAIRPAVHLPDASSRHRGTRRIIFAVYVVVRAAER